LFCSACGAYLSTDGSLSTTPLAKTELPEAQAQAKVADTREEGGGPIPPLRIKVLSSGRQVQLSSQKEIHLGRLDVARGIFPDLDLTPDGGLEAGVSRRHCKIHRQLATYLVEDIGSPNGTFLNGKRLTPYLPHVLNDGDELQLGRIKLEIIIPDADAE
jgi:pSer/pThr/pTyr-binding forkhead associated (FHA) protein